MRYRSLVVFIAVVGDKSHKSEEIVRPIGILLHLSIHLNIIVLIRISPISVIRSIINVNIMVISHKCDHQDLCMQEELPKIYLLDYQNPCHYYLSSVFIITIVLPSLQYQEAEYPEEWWLLNASSSCS